jgi:preprotein translocase subunit SecB
MTSAPNLPVAGYEMTRLYFSELVYRVVNPAELAAASGLLPVDLGWDWRIAGERSFDVLLRVALAPTAERLDQVRVTVVGTFLAEQDECSVPFEKFVQLHATALLLPYIREAVSHLTARGPFGSYHLPPINVHRLMKDFVLANSTGAAQLRDDPAVVAQLGPMGEAAARLIAPPPAKNEG